MHIKLLILFIMVFCHIVDDYYLQGILSSMKQKKWWKENAPDEIYKYDYLMALFMHSFSWAFMIMIAPTIYCFILLPQFLYAIPFIFITNLVIHFIIDNEKANKLSINLVQDQIIHLAQIFTTWLGLLVLS